MAFVTVENASRIPETGIALVVLAGVAAIFSRNLPKNPWRQMEQVSHCHFPHRCPFLRPGEDLWSAELI